MPDTYTHPNGYTVERDSMGASIVNRGEDYKTPLNADQVDALRDFFLAELDLWRDPETGALVLTNTWIALGISSGAVVYDGSVASWGYPDKAKPDRYDAAVARWRATLTPPPHEPQPGEVWRITFPEGQERNALVSCVDGMTAFQWDGDWHPVDGWPADCRRLLIEADGTVVAGDE